MVPIAGRPLIEWGVERLRAGGIERIVVVGHASDRALGDWLHDRGIALAIQHERRGIADAVCCALPLLGDAPAFLACACDSLFLPADLAAMLATGRAHPNAAIAGVLDMDLAATATRSAVRLDGDRVIEIVEKPPPGTIASTLVAAPLYRLPRALDPLLAAAQRRGGERHVSTALNDFVRTGGTVLAVHLRERLEITTAEDVERVGRRFGRV